MSVRHRVSSPASKRGAYHWLALLACFPLLVLAAELPGSVTTALREAGIPLSSVGVVVQRVDSPQALIRHNARQAMNPASAMKLVTTYAALELLGPAHTWKTEAWSEAPPVNGELKGNLYLRGSGDPRLALEQFSLLLRQLRQRGVAQIHGDLILDRSAFALPPHDPALFDNEPLRSYNAGPDALLVNLKSVRLTLLPDLTQKTVSVLTETPDEGLPLMNRLKLVDEACGDWREKFKVSVTDERIELQGQFPASCGEKALYLAPWAADRQVERLFRALWRELGGSLRGQVRAGVVPNNASLLTQHESPPLAEIVREVNKYSNNVMARQIFLSLDAARPASSEGAQRQVLAWLSEKGVRPSELVLDNGSGLSRLERISAEGLSQLLLAAWRSPVMPELMSSLPLAGVDGTLKKRLGERSVLGRAHLKTGYLDGARALAGYVLDRSGQRWVFVFLMNDPKSRQGKAAMDALLRWVAEQ